MKTLLMFCHDFPPTMAGGVLRPLKFAKYLPGLGWRPVVVTHRDEMAPMTDDAMLAELPPQALVLRTPPYVPRLLLATARQSAPAPAAGAAAAPARAGVAARLKRAVAGAGVSALRTYWLVPDRAVLWSRAALARAEAFLQTDRAHAVYTTAPPNSTHLLGLAMKRRHGLPWVAEFRDHWVGNEGYYPHLRHPYRRWREERMERSVVEAADWVVSATEPATRDLARRHPRHAAKFVTLSNGFDEADFAGSDGVPMDRETFRVRSFGSVGAGRPVEGLLEGLRRFAARNPDVPLRMEFFGQFGHDRQPWSEALGERVSWHGAVPHEQVPAGMRAAALLLVVQGAEQMGGSDTFAVPGKLFECARAGRPILGLVGSGPTRDLIERHGLGWTCPVDDAAGVEAILERGARAWRQGGAEPSAGADEFRRRFDRRSLTQDLVRLLDAVV
jgi:glycosyltransferase involved in cell wall biosynthesis